LLFVFAMLPQKDGKRRGQVYGPPAAAAFWVAEDELTAVETVQCAHYGKHGQVQVQIGPAQSQEFASSQAGVDGSLKQRVIRGCLSSVQESAHFFGVQRRHFLVAGLGRIDRLCGVANE